jgi:hypothetical protein
MARSSARRITPLLLQAHAAKHAWTTFKTFKATPKGVTPQVLRRQAAALALETQEGAAKGGTLINVRATGVKQAPLTLNLEYQPAECEFCREGSTFALPKPARTGVVGGKRGIEGLAFGAMTPEMDAKHRQLKDNPSLLDDERAQAESAARSAGATASHETRNKNRLAAMMRKRNNSFDDGRNSSQ